MNYSPFPLNSSAVVPGERIEPCLGSVLSDGPGTVGLESVRAIQGPGESRDQSQQKEQNLKEQLNIFGKHVYLLSC